MSHQFLLGQSFNLLPNVPNLNQTLLFIETDRIFSSPSQVSIAQYMSNQAQQKSPAQIPLQQKIQPVPNETITSTSLIKKKRSGCVCKKTKCLKMYCDCFAAEKECGAHCFCENCRNDGSHQGQLSKARQQIQKSLVNLQKRNIGKSCNCKKSQCQKKYCECYQAEILCSQSCKCEGCKNTKNFEQKIDPAPLKTVEGHARQEVVDWQGML